jgi:hypothetical protein
MKSSRLFALACVVAVSLVPAAAQEPPRLSFEVSVDGKVVARPEPSEYAGLAHHRLALLPDAAGDGERVALLELGEEQFH